MKKALVPALLAVQLLATSAALGWLILRKPAAPVAPPNAESTQGGAEHAAAPPANVARGAEHGAAPAAEVPRAGTIHARAAEPATGGAPPGAREKDGDGEQALAHLMEGNRRFVAGLHLNHPILSERAALATGQHPSAIVLSCSDSRVPPELVFDQSLGEIFVVRTAGNVADQIALGSMEYAAEHLHAKLLVVLGHERCGAVTAATEDGDPESPNLKALVAAISPSVKPLKARAKGAELVHLGVEANVDASLAHVLASSAILRERAAKKELTVKRAVYDLESGIVRVW